VAAYKSVPYDKRVDIHEAVLLSLGCALNLLACVAQALGNRLKTFPLVRLPKRGATDYNECLSQQRNRAWPSLSERASARTRSSPPFGAGGMGEVYRARDTKLGRAVAIKVILDEFASDEERVGRFEREAKMLAALNPRHWRQIPDFEPRPSSAVVTRRQGAVLLGRRAFVVTVTTGRGFEFSRPVQISRLFQLFGPTTARAYDIMPNGQRLIGILPSGQGQAGVSTQIQVVLNWFEELKQHVSLTK